MARKDSVSDWDETANNNDNVGGINIAENCAAANLNNAIRTVMAQIKTYSLAAEPGLIYSTKNADYTALAADDNTFFRFTAAATLSLTAAATLATGWHCWIKADGGAVIIDPNGAETVNGAATVTITDGNSALLICTGTSFFAITIAPMHTLTAGTGLTSTGSVASGSMTIGLPAVPALTAGAGLTSTGSIAGGNMTIALDIYTGSTSGNTTFAVGERVIVFADGANLARNGLIIPALNLGDSSSYVRSIHASAGALLDGTWRVRGGFGTDNDEWYEAVRVS